MLRSLKGLTRRPGALFLLAASAFGGILPDKIGEFTKGSPKTIGIPDQALYDEYGLDATEAADYGEFSVTAWRFRESTGAMAMFEARRPAGATISNLTKLAAKASDGVIFAFG